MPARFVVGGARSGKTRWCLERIAQACAKEPLGPPLIYLVPEQATYLAEKDLLTRGGLAGYTRAQVVSFTRLAYFLFAHEPAPQRPRLSSTHRDVLVSLLVARHRRSQPDSLISASGMEEALGDFVSESKQYLAPPEAFRRAVEILRGKEAAASPRPSTGMLETKLEQLAGMLEEFEAAVSKRFEDPQDTLANLSQTIATTPLLQGAEIYVDGFDGFTPVEEKVLVALARRAVAMHLTLAGSPERIRKINTRAAQRREPVFQPVEETYERLTRLFVENGVTPGDPVLLPPESEATDPALLHLTLNFFRRERKAAASAASIELYEAENQRDEARLAVEILARWMEEHGWRPGEVGILTRDLESYAAALTEAFTVLRIPAFIDWHEPLETHPFVVGIQTLIRAALQPQNTEHLVTLAKCGFLPIGRREADLLEHHVLQHPRSVGEWYQKDPWAAPPGRSPFDDDDPLWSGGEPGFDKTLNETRRSVASAVEYFRQRFASDAREGSFSQFLRALIDTINEHAELEERNEEDLRILRRIGELFAEAMEAAGEEHVSWDLAGELASRALGRLSLPRIPPMLDQVFTGQVDRSRPPQLKGVVVLGFAEGIFPRIMSNMTLLNDQERDLLEEAGLDLRPSARRMFDREAFHAYRAVSIPTERLALTRPRATEDGAPLPPSPFWRSVLEILPALEPRSAAAALVPERCWRPGELAAAAVRLLDKTHEKGPRQTLVARTLFPRIDDLSAFDQVLRSASWRNEAKLPPDTLDSYLEKRLRASVSQFESFSRCPFQHFVRYLLRPGERMHPEFEARDAGNFIHAVLRNFTRALRERQLIGSPEESIPFDEIFTEAASGPAKRIERSGLVGSATGRFVFDNLYDLVKDTARWLTASFARLPFQPVNEEVSLGGGAASPIPAYRLGHATAGWDVEVRGQIDRIDTVSNDKLPEPYCLVVDYKLRPKRFQYQTWEGGENLQLPVYLLAIQNAPEPLPRKPGGGLYLEAATKDPEGNRKYYGIIRSSIVKAIFPDEKINSLPFIDGSNGDPDEKPRPAGSAIKDVQFEELLRRTEEQVADIALRITSGDVRVFPSRYGTRTACTYCAYGAVCRIDYRVNRANGKVARNRRAILEDLGGEEVPE